MSIQLQTDGALNRSRFKTYKELGKAMWPNLQYSAAKPKMIRIRSGETNITTADLVKMADLLECTTDYLLGLSTDPKSSRFQSPV